MCNIFVENGEIVYVLEHWPSVLWSIRNFSFAIRLFKMRPLTSPKKPEAIHPVTPRPVTEELRSRVLNLFQLRLEHGIYQ